MSKVSPMSDDSRLEISEDARDLQRGDPRLISLLSKFGWEIVLDGDYPDVVVYDTDSGIAKVRKRIWNVLEGQLNLPGFVYQTFSLLVVALSVIAYVASTMPQYYEKEIAAFSVIEAVTSCLFAADWLLRLLCLQTNFLVWIRKPFTIIDLLTLLPYFILVGQGNSNPGISIFVAFRVLRFASVMSSYSTLFGAIALMLRKSAEAMVMMMVLISIALVTMSTLLYFAERNSSTYDYTLEVWVRNSDAPGVASPFQSIPHTFWWCITTITTVGYGDTFPTSPLGKFVGGVTMIFGILTLSFPITIFGSNFSAALAELDQKDREAKQALQAADEKRAASLAAATMVDAENELDQLHEMQSNLLGQLTEVNSKIAALAKRKEHRKSR